MKVKIHDDSLRLKNYEIKREQFQENRIFRTSTSQFCKELNGTGKEENESPDPGEATKFWSDIWNVPSTHNQDARWLQRVKQELTDVEKQELLRSRLKGSGNVFQECQIGRLLETRWCAWVLVKDGKFA